MVPLTSYILLSDDILAKIFTLTVLETVQMNGVYSTAYSTVHSKKPLKLFEIRVGHSPGFGLQAVAILP